ncbi:MAG: tetratricopeptide repeat protein [Lachnospiraceae bacterium]|nr:tetratricopeptide repeat protein [Lachnospiraceae bacterium]
MVAPEEIFHILGIALTKDETAIKNAYRERLKLTNPEDHPEEFKRLRQAYEEACAYAKKKEQPAEERDETPSGLWVEKAASIYRSLPLRCSEDAWKALFNEDAFLSLEENEECRKKLLIFMMSHFCFPFAIWKLLDKNLNIVKDREHLKEGFPTDFVRFILRRCEEDDGVNYALFHGPDEGDYDLFLRFYREAWEALDGGDEEGAERSMQSGLALGITHPYMEIVRARIYAMQGMFAETEEVLEELIRCHGEDSWLLYQAGEYYWGKEVWDKAVTYFKKLKSLDEKHYMANVRLAQYYEKTEDYPAAEECIRMIPHAAQDMQLQDIIKKVNAHKRPILQKKWETEQDLNAAWELAHCFYDEKRYFAALQLLEAMGKKLPEAEKEKYYQLLAGVYMGMAEFDKALSATEHCKEEPEYIARVRINAYHSMGRGFTKYYDKALVEYEKIWDGVEGDIKLMIEMTQLYEEMEEFEKSLELGRKLWEDYRLSFSWVLMLKAYAGMYDASGVIYCGEQCILAFPDYAYPYEEMARVYYQTGQPEKLSEILARAKENKVQSCYLESYAYNGEEIPEGFDINKELKSFDSFYHATMVKKANLNSYKYGYPVISKFLRMYPCNAILNKRGLFSMAAKDTEKAMADFRKILEDDPADAFANNNVGCLYKYMEKYEEALSYFNRAVYYMYREDRPEPVTVHYGNLAHTYELLGAYDRALKVYQRIYEEFNKGESMVRDLVANYSRCGQPEKAKELIEQQFFSDANKKNKFLMFYRAYLYAANWEETSKHTENYRQAIYYNAASDRTTAMWCIYYHMHAWQLMLQNQYEPAMEAIGQAIEKSKTPSTMKKDKIDVLINKIFFLTIKQEQKRIPEKEMTVAPQAAEKSKGASFWSRLFSGKKQETPTVVEKTAVQPVGLQILEDDEEIKECLEALNKILDQMCRKQLNENKPRNPVETEAFFYKERYVRFVEFILALYGEGSAAGEKALAIMEESTRCRLCNHGCCMRLKVAKALLLEKQGRAGEAMEIFKELLKEQPYNTFAQVKLLFEK